MRSRVLAVVTATALVVAAAAVVVPAGAASPRGGAPKFTGAPILIGVTYMCDAPTPPQICEIAPSAQAAVKTVNSQGGVKTADGQTHQLKVVTCNNENDRSQIADCAREFVDKEVAFATGAAAFSDELVPILEDAGIAYFVPTCASDCTAEGTSANSHVLTFTLALFQGLVKELTDEGYKKIVAVAQGVGVGIGGLTRPIAEAGGATLSITEAPTDNPNWAQVVEQATQDADVLFSVMAEDQTKAFLDAYGQAGKDIPVTSVIGIVTNDLIAGTGGANSPLKGGISTGWFPPAEDKAWADYRKGIRKHAKGTQLEPAGQTVWLAVQLAATIMEGIDGPVTAQSFVGAVDATAAIPTLGGKLPPGKSFQQPEGIFPRIFNNDYWGPLKINGETIGPTRGATFAPAPSAS